MGYIVKAAIAEQQAAAGLKYRMVIALIEEATGKCGGFFTATVYDDLFGQLLHVRNGEWGDTVKCRRAKGGKHALPKTV
jgi:hypothetical protein